MIFINYLSYCNQQQIIKNQGEMIIQFTNTESIELFRLRSKLSKIEKENSKKNKEIESMKNTVEVYRKLRHNKAGYFLLTGDPSNRTFRNQMRDLGSDKLYIGKRDYMVKLKHLNKFDNKCVTV